MTETITQEKPAVETGSKPVSWAPVPRVNLLPIQIVEDRAFRRTQILLAGAVLLTAGVVGVGTFWAQNGVSDAQAEADAARAQVSRLQAQQAEYASIPQIIARVEAAEAARQSIYAKDVRWYRYLNNLDRFSGEAGVELTDMTIMVGGQTAGAASATGSDVLTPSGIGTLTFTGTSREYRQVSTWLESLDKISGLKGAKLASATKTEAVAPNPAKVDFSNTAVLDAEALSGRYQPKQTATDSTDSTDSTGSTGTTGTTTEPGTATN